MPSWGPSATASQHSSSLLEPICGPTAQLLLVPTPQSSPCKQAYPTAAYTFAAQCCICCTVCNVCRTLHMCLHRFVFDNVQCQECMQVSISAGSADTLTCCWAIACVAAILASTCPIIRELPCHDSTANILTCDAVCSLPGGWTTHMCLCCFLFVWFFVFGVGFGMWASILNLVQNVSTYSVFADCYLCAGIDKTHKRNG